MAKEYLSFKEAAGFLCISTSKLYKMTHRNEIRYYKMGRLNVFGIKELQQYLESKAVPTIKEIKENALNRSKQLILKSHEV